MTFYEDVRVFRAPSTANLTLEANTSDYTRVYSPDYKWGADDYVVVENSDIRVVVQNTLGAQKYVGLYVRTTNGYADGTTWNAEWTPFLGTSSSFCSSHSGSSDIHKFLGVVAMTTDEVILRRREYKTTGDFIEYDLIIRRGTPVIEVRYVNHKGSTLSYQLFNTAGTLGLHRLSAVWDYEKNDAVHGTATDASGETVILINGRTVVFVGQQDGTTAPNKSVGSNYTVFSPAQGSLFIGGMYWASGSLADVNDKPLQREAEALTTELTTQGTWTGTADAAAWGGNVYGNAGANGDYVQYPLHVPEPGLYVVAFRDYDNSTDRSNAWTVTVGSRTFTFVDSGSSGAYVWRATGPAILGTASTVRFTTTNTTIHRLDCFALIPLWASTGRNTSRFPLNALYQAMNKTTVVRDVVHLEQV